MPPFASPNSYTHHRFSAEIITHGMWLNYRFCLSYRDVEALLFARGIMVTYEAIPGSGAGSSGKRMPINCGAGVPNELIRGIWMRSFSRFVVSGMTSGGRSIRTAMSSISWCNAGGTRRRRRNFSASSSKDASMLHGSSSRIS
jgi:hypothetical protein